MASKLRQWALESLALPLSTPIGLAEWIAMDSRAPTQHVVSVVVGTSPQRRRFLVEKASDRIRREDLQQALTMGEVPE